MGLNQGDTDHRKTRCFRDWVVPALVVTVALVIAVAGDNGRELLRYDRIAIANGEILRLISGHFAHLGWSHFALNAAGIVLVFFLVGPRFSARLWLLICALIIVVIDAGFWFFQPQLIWYVGLSGLLHGCLAAGVMEGLRQRQFDDWLIAGLLVLKLGYEQLVGPLPGSEASAGGSVVVAAHLYGAIAGALIGATLSFRKAATAAI